MTGRIGTNVERAVEILRNGGVIGLPTETVYGLAADAAQAAAVDKIFRIKGRPTHHPLIAHVDSIEMARQWSSDFNETAEMLGSTLWPGPLSLIVRKATRVLPQINGGMDTIALRVPGHQMAIAVISTLGSAVAAPSANKFGRVSPTSAQHVIDDLGAAVDYVLDGGPCRIGIESTIVDCTSVQPVIVRPGGVSLQDIEKIIDVDDRNKTSMRVSGNLPAHYAPDCLVHLADDATQAFAIQAQKCSAGTSRILDASADSVIFAVELYSLLRQCDIDRLDHVIVIQPAQTGIGLAIRDRLRKASHGSIDQSR